MHGGELGWRILSAQPIDGQGREPGWGLQGINVERSLQGLSPGLSKAQRGGVKGGSERGGGGEGAGRPVKKLQEGGGIG